MGLTIAGGPNLAPTYRTVHDGVARFDAPASGTYIIGVGGQSTAQLTTNGSSGIGTFYLDPADYAVAGKTTKMRLRVAGLTNDTAAATSFPIGLYPVTAGAGTAGLLRPTLGTIVSGSAVTITTPAALTALAAVDSGDFTAPAAGQYIFACVIAVGAAASSSISIHARLEVRNV